MSDELQNANDHDDRLLDLALREVIGGETPPDLSERIFAAANDHTGELSTLEPGDEAMNDLQVKRKKPWLSLAVAATLLLGFAALLLPANQAARESARGVSRASDLKREAAGENSKSVGLTGLAKPASEAEIVKELSLGDAHTHYYADEWSELKNRRKMYAKVDLAKPAENDNESSPRGGGYGGGGYGRRGQVDRIFVGTELMLEKRFNPNSPQSVPALTTDLDAPSRQRSFGRTTPDSGVVAVHQELLRELYQEIARHQTLSEELSGADSVVASTVLNMLINDARLIQQQIVEAKKSTARNGSVELKRLGERYDEKVAQIRKAGQRSREVSLLVAKIEQLQQIERQLAAETGTGPRASGDQYTRIYENPFIIAEGEKAVSTFSIDVDTASYANVRQFLMQSGQLPPPDAVRIEELVNYFDYDYSGPTGEVPFAAHVEVTACPWHREHRLVRVGIKGREIERESRPQTNLVFLIDVSGSMNEPAKLPLLVEGMKLLTRELGENDRVAIVVYASSEGLALPSTRGDKQETILAALEQLRAGGSTAGGAGIQLAYQIAEDNFLEGGVNRVILATDGDFNVGTTSTADLQRMAEQKAKETGVFLTVLGFGRGNLNDAMMEAISGKGNGNYHYVDNRAEARKVLVEEIAGTLVTIAKDVKLQIEFNPAQVAGYRLIGYENRMLRTEDFNDDKKDAGEIGAGHTVTALYEIVPSGRSVDTPGVDPLKYQAPSPRVNNGVASDVPESDELLTLKIRYKQPDGDKSTKLEFPITDVGGSFAEATDDLKFAAAVASFGMLLRDSEHRGDTSYDAVLEIAEEGSRRDPHDRRAEFLQIVRRAKALSGE